MVSWRQPVLSCGENTVATGGAIETDILCPVRFFYRGSYSFAGTESAVDSRKLLVIISTVEWWRSKILQ